MSSPNPRQAEANLELALYNAEEVDIFTNSNSIGQEVDTAQNLFNTAVELCSDSFSDDRTVTVASCSARKLHSWVVQANADHSNHGRFSEEHTILDEVRAGDESAYYSKAARHRQT